MKYLYLCSCGAAFLDGRKSVQTACLCGSVYVVYQVGPMLSFPEAVVAAETGAVPQVYQ